MLPVTASAGGSTLEFWLQQSRCRTCRVDPAHILLPAQGAGTLTGGCGWGAVLHMEGSGLSCPREVGRKGCATGALQLRHAVPIEATFHFFPMLGRCHTFTTSDSFDTSFGGIACTTLVFLIHIAALNL